MSVDSPEDLYGVTLDRFVAERTALVQALRSEQRRAEADEVAALRKPSVAAWAVNQLVRTEPEALQALFDAGQELAQTQAHATAGTGAGDAMRDATHRQRAALRRLIDVAEGLRTSTAQPLSQATIDRLSETLRAAASDDEARRQVATGCLTQELRFVGVGIGGLTQSVAESNPRATPTPTRRTARRGKQKGNREVEQAAAAREAESAREAQAAREATRERIAVLKTARRAQAAARRAATRADKERAAAQARRERAAASLKEAETLLFAAAQRAEDAATKLTTAEQAVRDLDQA